MKKSVGFNRLLPVLLMFMIVSVNLAVAEEASRPTKADPATASAADDAAKKSPTAETPVKPILKMQTVYVMDFELDGADIKKDEGVLGKTGIKKRLSVLSRRDDAAGKVEKFINLMSDTMVEQFKKAGLTASRIKQGSTLPNDGVLVKGLFTSFDEGSRLKRATVGFGTGETRIDTYVTVFDLPKSKVSPVLILGDDKNSRKMPGAVVTLNPYVAAAKFVMEKNASAKTVKRLAGDIADEILKYREPPVAKTDIAKD